MVVEVSFGIFDGRGGIVQKSRQSLFGRHALASNPVFQDGKAFRKHLAKELTGHIDIEGEKAASKFLVSIGVIFICWPYSWKNPALGDNMAVLDESVITITKVEKVNPDKK